MAGGDDRLSDLPDDILRRVLQFAPLKEAASSTALSRRWRAPLWLSSAAVNLETGVDHYYYGRRDEDKARFFSSRDAYVAAAAGAFDAAADVPVTRLTLCLESDFNESADDFMSWRRDMDKVVSRYTGLIEVALSHRAARRARDQTDYHLFGDRESNRLYTVTLDSLPLETLRVLEIANCKGLLYRRDLVLPRLSSLRLTHCDQHLSSLQHVIDAAPVLAYLRLEFVDIDATDNDNNAPPSMPNEATTHHRLRCPVVTVLVLDSSTWNYKKTLDIVSMEIDAPRLRRFRYKGPLCSFSFSPQPLELEQVDLDFFEHRSNHGNNNEDADRDLETFWRFAQRFTSTKEMRMRVKHLEDIAVLSEVGRVELLPAFRRIERLDVQGEHWTKGKDATMTILNLLRCCSVLAALWINLTAKHEDASDKKGKEIQIAALLGPRHLFQCLQNSLRRVGLQFQLEKADCLGVKLIKFFAENAMVLEEMHIHCGDEKLFEDMNPKTEKWNSKRRKLGATSFVVLPLKR